MEIHLVAILEAEYAGETRPMVAVFDRNENDIKIITVYPTDKKEILKRLEKGRWTHEKQKN